MTELRDGSSGGMARASLAEHLDPARGPKRILALDGGGVRGILSVAYLARLEDELRQRHRNPRLVLSDYFDLIAGTSTGAIIAAGLALGYPVDDVRALYMRFAGDVFARSWWRRGILRARYSNRRLDALLRDQFGEATTLGCTALRTGLMIMAKRLDTASAWTLTNNPRNPYYAADIGKGNIANADYPLWRVVRASTAAPLYFAPEQISVAPGVEGRFIDGGVTTANNPALKALETATVAGHGFGWPKGESALLIVSVGTGRLTGGPDSSGLLNRIAAGHAVSAVVTLMNDAAEHTEKILQWLSRSPTARPIDGLVGTLDGDLLCATPALSYLRYNVDLDEAWLRIHLGRDYSPEQVEALRRLDDPSTMSELWAIGNEAAARQVESTHLPAVFDLALGRN